MGESRTVQSDKDYTDVNYIVNHFQRTGEITHVNQATPQYADVSELHGDPVELAERRQEAIERLEAIEAELQSYQDQSSPGEIQESIEGDGPQESLDISDAPQSSPD